MYVGTFCAVPLVEKLCVAHTSALAPPFRSQKHMFFLRDESDAGVGEGEVKKDSEKKSKIK